MAVVYLVQHAEKEPQPGDPGLTARGREVASRTGVWLRGADLAGIWASPLRRARETADLLAAATGLEVRTDDRLRERANWDGRQPVDRFVADWVRCAQDRDFVPAGGDSSRQAGDRLLAFLADQVADPAPWAAVTHGGVTVDLLRTLLGDRHVPAHLIEDGIPSCAVTVLDGLRVVRLPEVGAGLDGHSSGGPAE